MVNNLTDVLVPFLNKPFDTFYQRELSKLTKIPRSTLRNMLIGLEDKGIITSNKKGKQVAYNLNFKNPKLLEYLVIAEKYVILQKCDDSLLFQELKDYLINNIEGSIIMFGSATQSFNNANDIDIVIVGECDNEKIDAISAKINKEIHVIKVLELSQISNTLKKELIKKHLLIKNSEELLRWLLWQN